MLLAVDSPSILSQLYTAQCNVWPRYHTWGVRHHDYFSLNTMGECLPMFGNVWQCYRWWRQKEVWNSRSIWRCSTKCWAICWLCGIPTRLTAEANRKKSEKRTRSKFQSEKCLNRNEMLLTDLCTRFQTQRFHKLFQIHDQRFRPHSLSVLHSLFMLSIVNGKTNPMSKHLGLCHCDESGILKQRQRSYDRSFVLKCKNESRRLYLYDQTCDWLIMTTEDNNL